MWLVGDSSESWLFHEFFLEYTKCTKRHHRFFKFTKSIKMLHFQQWRLNDPFKYFQSLESQTWTNFYFCIKPLTAWKVLIFGVFLVRLFPYSDWIRRDNPYLSVFSPKRESTGQKIVKYGHFLRSGGSNKL